MVTNIFYGRKLDFKGGLDDGKAFLAYAIT